MKICTGCKLEKEESEFHRKLKNSDKLRERCKKCLLKQNKEWAQAHPQTVKNSRERHKESIKARHAEYYVKYRERINALHKKHRNSSSNYKFLAYTKNASYRNIEFSLSKEEFMTYWNLPCNYCGDEIKTIGLDRVDSSKGYTLDNIIPCCKICNRMKMALTKEVFFDKILKIYKKCLHDS